MKYKGKKIEGPNEEIIIIPRGDSDDFIFTARAVLSYDEFDKLLKEPTPKSITRAGENFSTPLLNDPDHIKAQQKYDRTRLSWLIVKSLEATEDLEWETVDINDPKTWDNYDTELHDAGFSSIEIGRIIRGVMIANSLDQRKIDEARKHFLVMRREAAEQLSSQQDGQKTTPSGQLAKDSVSNPTE